MEQQISNKHFEREAVLCELLAERNRMLVSLVAQVHQLMEENKRLRGENASA